MIKWIKNYFKNKKKIDNIYSKQHLDDYKKIWENLDTQLKECAQESFDFGRKKDFKLKLNEVGMVQLIQHLDKHGFEIRKKELSRLSQI